MRGYNGFTAAERAATLSWFREQIRLGLREPPMVCCACRQTEGVLDSHTEDYSKPFGPHIGEFPMCYRCHMAIHCRFRNRTAWDDYRAAIRRGIRYAPINGRWFGVFCRQLRGASVPFAQHEPPNVLVLDLIEAGHYIQHLDAARVRQSPERLASEFDLFSES